ncbi:acyltransferase family protein [Demequina mangrovi]|uniref:Peptidoglycan/LPS O-acetylase OafA/YrhL, contains acyltransferase and SGNH-hydrolase domains n=1 Tax=Demequina mangrovi TaxID=1043493 RepID=A0A1H6YDS2_9MICO|nr:acyltransferase family protein [Demequina mangrovi]SEJ39433.1 Peptidoglycan/LPS O-acetylase OafA/YrhL, contains acyltransferase and SGNH-hydrolase domains [Demequina mangrovi]
MAALTSTTMPARRAAPPTNASRFRLDIQGLRAIAVAAVVLYHAGVPFLQRGYLGVDVFFVISGFLITGHLLKRLETTGRVGYAEFYARRARRILPASFTVLLLSIGAAMLWYPPLLMHEVWRGALATAFYVPNIYFAMERTDYLSGTNPSLFQHYWSLGVEEQFYLLWPIALALGWAFARTRRALFIVVAFLVAGSFAAGVVGTVWNQPMAFFMLPTRAWELGIGGLVAFAAARHRAPLGRTTASVVSWSGLACILLTLTLYPPATMPPGTGALPAVLATAAVILAGSRDAPSGASIVLSVRPLTFLGTISYALYLVHWPALMVPQAAFGFGTAVSTTTKVGIALLCVPLAWLLFRYIEKPARNASVLADAPAWRTLAAAVGASFAAVASATLAYEATKDTPLAGRDSSVVPHGYPSSYVPSDLAPDLWSATGDLPELYENGCNNDFATVESTGCLFGSATAPRIALFGDSHAAQWYPALTTFAEANGYAVQTLTKDACPAVSADFARDGRTYQECTLWRDGAIAELNAQSLELVVISSHVLAPLAPEPKDRHATWTAALGRTLARVEAHAVVLADTPSLDRDPVLCLAANLDEALACSTPREAAIDPDLQTAEARTATLAGATYVDLTDHICSGDSCPPILGSTLVYRDEHHITATFAEQLAAVLGGELLDVLDAESSKGQHVHASSSR